MCKQDIQQLVEAAALNAVYAQQIKRVRELHKPNNIGSAGHPEWLICQGCVDDSDGQMVDYPCSTIKALDGEK